MEKLTLREKLVKTPKINKVLIGREKIKIEGKTRQIAENKQTFDLSGKIEIEGKNRQNAENKQTFSLWKLMISIPHILDFHIPTF